MESISADSQFHALFDHIPGVLFFAKDREGKLWAANHGLLERYGHTTLESFIGKTDFDLLPQSLAEKFRQDDLSILETGEPMLDIVEVFVNQQGLPGWFLTNKLPIFSKQKTVIGVMGTIQEYDSHREIIHADADLSAAIDYIGANFVSDISVRDLARMSNLSVRQFERRFKRYLKSTPQQFIMKMRVLASCDALRRGLHSLSAIAVSMGFYDQSAFTRQFRKHMGLTPSQYRKQSR